jgi:U3 small nucleolar RNA-associated protein 3
MLEGEEADLSDDDLKNEVFALNNLHAVSDFSEEEEPEELPDETDEGEIEKVKAPKAKKATKTTTKKSSKDLVASSSESSSDLEERHESWGRKKSVYYSTNAGAIESDDEEGQRLEEAEVVKLQAQARDVLDEDDFGVNDAPPMLLSMNE